MVQRDVRLTPNQSICRHQGRRRTIGILYVIYNDKMNTFALALFQYSARKYKHSAGSLILGLYLYSGSEFLNMYIFYALIEINSNNRIVYSLRFYVFI